MSRRHSAVSPRVGARRASPPPGATWPTLAPSPPEQPSKQRRRCQPDGAPERRAARWSCDRSFLRRRSWKRKPDPDLLPKTKKEDKDGAQGCSVSRFAFAGLCDNLQQRAMSRRCLPLQQPLRRVSKDPIRPLSHLLSRGSQPSAHCCRSARQQGSFLRARDAPNLEQRGALMLTGVIVLGCVHVKDIMMMFSACPADPAVSFSPAELQRETRSNDLPPRLEQTGACQTV